MMILEVLSYNTGHIKLQTRFAGVKRLTICAVSCIRCYKQQGSIEMAMKIFRGDGGEDHARS